MEAIWDLVIANLVPFTNSDIVVGLSGEIIAIKLLQDYSFNSLPLVYIVESDVDVFYGSKTIGVPSNVKVTYNGTSYYNDTTVSSLFTSHQILQVTNLDEKNFLNKDTQNFYLDFDNEKFLNGIKEQSIKDALKDATNEAFKKEVFGAPTFIANNKIFWGQDRLEYAVEELSSN